MKLADVIERLRSDWSFVSAFMDNPELALAGASLAPAEKGALLSRNAKSLLSLGIAAEQAVGALSGCHRGPSTIVPPTQFRRTRES